MDKDFLCWGIRERWVGCLCVEKGLCWVGTKYLVGSEWVEGRALDRVPRPRLTKSGGRGGSGWSKLLGVWKGKEQDGGQNAFLPVYFCRYLSRCLLLRSVGSLPWQTEPYIVFILLPGWQRPRPRVTSTHCL
jgi:hypothetical protein